MRALVTIGAVSAVSTLITAAAGLPWLSVALGLTAVVTLYAASLKAFTEVQ